LERRRRERSARPLGERIRLDRRDRERGVAQPVGERGGLGRIEEHDIAVGAGLIGCDLSGSGIEVTTLGEAAVVELHERGAERLIVGKELGFEVVPPPGAETHTRALALHDHSYRDALHASGRRGLTATEHAPQHG
jgi:hypothetical protein